MTATEVLDRLEELGVTAWVYGEKVRLQPGSKVPSELMAEVRHHKADLLTLLAAEPAEPSWPPADAAELLDRWEELGCREIPLSPGVTISDLRVWLFPGYPQDRPAEHLASVRGQLLEGLPAEEVPEADPFLEQWRLMCLPFWRKKLESAEDEWSTDFANMMLRLLGDDEPAE
jgi:hypothetical protein